MNTNSQLFGILVAVALSSLQAVAQPTRRLMPNVEFALPISADVANDGSVVVADFTQPAVYYASADGKMRWSVTAKGSGPGDVLRPYRVALGDSTVWVYDYSAKDVSVFTRAGKFARRFRLSLALTIVDDIVAIGDTALVVLGVTRQTGYESNAIHVFNGSGLHRRSFGDLAVTDDRSKLSLAGTGTLSRTARNTLLYTRKGPYQLLEYRVDGQLVRSITPPVAIAAVVDSMMRIETNAEGRERVSSRAAQIRFPLRAVPLADGYLLSGVSDRGTLRWWMHPPSGAPLSVTVPKGLSPSAWNARTCELVTLAGGDDEPALVAVDFRAILTQVNINMMGCKR